MYSAILLVAMSTVGGHKCHGCAVVCSAPADCGGCYAADVCYASACSCAKPKKHKSGLFKRLFGRKCHGACNCAADCSSDCGDAGCSSDCGSYGCAGDCGTPVDCDPCTACAPSYSEPSCAAPVMEAAPAVPTAPATEAAPPSAGFKVERSPFVAVSFRQDRAAFKDEPVVIFARR